MPKLSTSRLIIALLVTSALAGAAVAVRARTGDGQVAPGVADDLPPGASP